MWGRRIKHYQHLWSICRMCGAFSIEYEGIIAFVLCIGTQQNNQLVVILWICSVTMICEFEYVYFTPSPPHPLHPPICRLYSRTPSICANQLEIFTDLYSTRANDAAPILRNWIYYTVEKQSITTNKLRSVHKTVHNATIFTTLKIFRIVHFQNDLLITANLKNNLN